MTLEAVLIILAQATYLWVAGSTLVLWLRHRDRTRRDIFLVFASLTVAILVQDLQRLRPSLSPIASPIFMIALLAQPYLALRVAQSSVRVPTWLRRLALAGLLLSYASLFFLRTASIPATTVMLGYFVLLEGCDAVLFLRGASLRQGISRRRWRLAALGSGLLVLIFFVALAVLLVRARQGLPETGDTGLTPLLQLLAIGSGLGYYFGFAPPRWLRRTWQLEDLHDFLRRASGSGNGRIPALDHLPAAATHAVGASASLIARSDAGGRALSLVMPGSPSISVSDLAAASPQVDAVWRGREARLVRLPAELGSVLSGWAEECGAQSVYMVPIVGSMRAWGLLILAMRFVPLFVPDDLDMLDLLCEQSVAQLDHAVLIDELRAANERLEQQIDEYSRSEARFRGLLESAPDAVVVVDQAGIIQLVNSQAVKMFGYERSELTGQPVEMLVPRHLQKKHTRHRAAYSQDHPARPMGIGLELFGVRRDGSEFPVEISLSPLEVERGLLVSAAIRDVTQRKRDEEQIRTLNSDLEQRAAQLEAANKELESFSYSVSHDLRAPLRSIDGFSQALLEDYGENLAPEARGYLERVRSAAQRMAELIDDLLNLSRVTRSSLRPRFINLSAMAREIVDSFCEQEPGRRVDLDIMPDLMVTADPHLMRQVLENLLSNAWKFTSKREQARIEFGQQNKTRERTFFVRDNGVGFDMAYVDKLFGVFQRLHSVSEYPGTGVGLATVQRIIKIHGGRIWAESSQGQGTTFYFTL